MGIMTKDRMKSVKVISNNDMAAIDFLSDLDDRSMLKELDRHVNVEKYETICMLNSFPEKNLFVLLLYGVPLDYNDPPNRLILFAHDNLCAMKIYFERWVSNTADGDKEVIGALNDIIGLISFELDKLIKKQIRSDLPG